MGYLFLGGIQLPSPLTNDLSERTFLVASHVETSSPLYVPITRSIDESEHTSTKMVLFDTYS